MSSPSGPAVSDCLRDRLADLGDAFAARRASVRRSRRGARPSAPRGRRAGSALARRSMRSIDRSGWALLTGRTGAISTISPPPTVSARPLSRSTNRSPGSSGRARRDADAHESRRTGCDRVAHRSRGAAPDARPNRCYTVYAPRRDTSWPSAPSVCSSASKTRVGLPTRRQDDRVAPREVSRARRPRG